MSGVPSYALSCNVRGHMKPPAGVILVLNAGSSSIKFSLFGGEDRLPLVYRGEVDGIGTHPRFTVRDAQGRPLEDTRPAESVDRRLGHHELLELLLDWLNRHAAGTALVAAGHRIVHGGVRFAAPVLITDSVLRDLDGLVPLAPLHQPHNLGAVRALARIKPELPQVACFDTAFHCAQPPVAQAFALPRELSDAGIKRYGFHGLSYEYIARVLPGVAGEAASGRVVVAHLGNGASMCALRGGQSVATTMSFTALDGLPMGTRPGALDPGVVLHLLTEGRMDANAVTDLLYHRSGLLGVSGISGDMRDLLASPAPGARAAIELFVYRVGRELGSLVAALGGLDALVFTAGIGEYAAPIRASVCDGAAWLGIQLDPEANARGGPRISRGDSRVAVWVMSTNEELMIAEHTRALVRS
jgi:acetate kinase